MMQRANIFSHTPIEKSRRKDYFEWNFCSGDGAYSAAVIVAVAAVAYETSAQRDLQFVRICQTK